MPKKRAKKLNPHRIPLAKNAIDKDAILEEAMRDDMYRAWLLVVNAIIEQEQVGVEEIPALADTVNRYISGDVFRRKSKDSEQARAERVMGIPNPYTNLHPNMIKSPVELENFKKKVFQIATQRIRPCA